MKGEVERVESFSGRLIEAWQKAVPSPIVGLDALVRERDAAVRAAAIREFADHLTGQVFEDNATLKAILGIAVRFLLLDQPKDPKP